MRLPRPPLPRDRRARAGVLALLAVVALNVVGLVWGVLAPEPTGPASSSYATQPAGVAAWAELLERRGRRVVRLREEPRAARLDPGATVVLLDPGELGAADRRALARFVRAGGRLVVAGRGSEPLAEELLARAPRRGDDGAPVAVPLAPVPEAVGRVVGAGDAAWTRGGDALPALGGGEGTLLLVAGAGRGRVALLADATPLHNRFLARADNAALALALAPPGRPVAFVESVHGFGAASGLAALPARWKALLVGLVLAALVLLLARARRFGPPEDEARPLAPARRAYVDSLARTLARTGDPAAAAPIGAAARRLVLARSALPGDASPGEVRRAAERLGLDDDEARVVAEGPAGRDDVLAAGRALARLREGVS